MVSGFPQNDNELSNWEEIAPGTYSFPFALKVPNVNFPPCIPVSVPVFFFFAFQSVLCVPNAIFFPTIFSDIRPALPIFPCLHFAEPRWILNSICVDGASGRSFRSRFDLGGSALPVHAVRPRPKANGVDLP